MNAVSPAALLAERTTIFRQAETDLALAATAVEAAQVAADGAELKAADLRPDADEKAVLAADVLATEAATALRLERRRHGSLARASDLARVELEEGITEAKAAASDMLHGLMDDLNLKFRKAAERLHEIVRGAAAVALAGGHGSAGTLVRLQIPRSILDPHDVLMIGDSSDLATPKEGALALELAAAIRDAEAATRPPALIAV